MVRYEHVASDGTKLIFREPVKGEAKALMRFINPFVDERMSGLLINKKVSLKNEVKWLESRLGEIRSRSVVMLLVELDGRVVGSCHMGRLSGKHSHRAVMGVALSREIRGKGVGEALMRRAMALGLGRFRGIETIELSTFAYNDRAQSLYRKLGFKEYGRVPRSAKEGDAYFDEVLMRFELGPPGMS
jgi:RimJ/RimL family protein N-acetyltransferase